MHQKLKCTYSFDTDVKAEDWVAQWRAILFIFYSNLLLLLGLLNVNHLNNDQDDFWIKTTSKTQPGTN